VYRRVWFLFKKYSDFFIPPPSILFWGQKNSGRAEGKSAQGVIIRFRTITQQKVNEVDAEVLLTERASSP
jgi:hypothetical protein